VRSSGLTDLDLARPAHGPGRRQDVAAKAFHIQVMTRRRGGAQRTRARERIGTTASICDLYLDSSPRRWPTVRDRGTPSPWTDLPQEGFYDTPKGAHLSFSVMARGRVNGLYPVSVYGTQLSNTTAEINVKPGNRFGLSGRTGTLAASLWGKVSPIDNTLTDVYSGRQAVHRTDSVLYLLAGSRPIASPVLRESQDLRAHGEAQALPPPLMVLTDESA
jgi:hypothetical protein